MTQNNIKTFDYGDEMNATGDYPNISEIGMKADYKTAAIRIRLASRGTTTKEQIIERRNQRLK